MSKGMSQASNSEDSAFGSTCNATNPNALQSQLSGDTVRNTYSNRENTQIRCTTKTRPKPEDLIVTKDDLVQAAKQMRRNNVDLISQSLRTNMACFDELDLQKFDSHSEYLINFISNGPLQCKSSVLRPVSIMWPDTYDVMVEDLAKLDSFLLSTQFRERPVEWMLKRGLTIVPDCRQCKEKMMLTNQSNILRWLCARTQQCQNYCMPVLRPSFFSGYESVGLDKLLFLTYYWATCTPATSLHGMMKVQLETVNRLWTRIQNVCRTAIEKAYPRHRLTNVITTEANLQTDTSAPIDLISIKVNNIFVVCAKQPQSNLVRLGLYIPKVSAYSFIELTESWFAHGASVRISEHKFSALARKREDIKLNWVPRIDMVSSEGQFDRDSAFGYIVSQLSHVLKDFKSSSLSTEQLKLILAEIQWREMHGTTPFDAFNNIVRHIAEYGDQSDYYAEPRAAECDKEATSLSSDATNYLYAESYFYATQDPVDRDGRPISRFTEPQCDEELPRPDVRLSCHECNMMFETFEFSLHMISHVERNRREADRADRLERAMVECKHCFKLFSRADIGMHSTLFRLDLHVVQFGCRICCVRLASREAYLEHLRRMHFEHETPYRCPSCPFASSIQREVLIHFQEEHRHSMILLCPLCLKSFTVLKPESISRHKMLKLSKMVYTHLAQHYAMSRAFTCNNCCLCFTSKDKLLAHTRLHHNPLEARPPPTEAKLNPFVVSEHEREHCVVAHPMELFIANKRPNLAAERAEFLSESGNQEERGRPSKRSGPRVEGAEAVDDALVGDASDFLEGGGASLMVRKQPSRMGEWQRPSGESMSSESILKMMSRLTRSDAIVANKSVILSPLGLAARCCECRELITSDHFVAQIKCPPKLKCNFKSYCPRAATKHRLEAHHLCHDHLRLDPPTTATDEQAPESPSATQASAPSQASEAETLAQSSAAQAEILVVTIDDSSSSDAEAG